MNTKISYLYRDADNYKMHNKCVIAGTLTTEQARTIKDSCEMGEYFIPRQVGLPERRFDRYDPAVDHCWFELDEDCFSETVEPPTVALTATELVNRFEGCKNNWRDESYTPQMGGMKFLKVNARTDKFQHLEVFDKPALFTNRRIARDTVPQGWYCYDIRGSDDDPGELCYMEENVVVNHAGSVLMPEKLAMPKSGRLDVRDELGFLDEGDMTLREFCEAHQLPYPAENMKFHIRPARPEEAGLFYTPHPEEDKRLGTVGHVRMDFGRSGNEFWHTWWPRGPEELNSPVFKAELQEVVDTLRESMLKSRFAMERFCYEHGGKISGGWTQNYGYIVETEHYRYCLRCNPSPGDYNCYCTAYDLDVQRQNMARDKPLAGRVTYANGDAQEFTDAEAFLECVREELPYRPTTGFRYEVLTDDPSVRKQVDDMIFDLYGEEAPCRQEDHEPQPEQGMTFGGM
ncbi:MAG: LPD28 domain-containing protein [Dysosmobacter sp.]